MADRIVKQLAHVCLFAADLDATAAFYRDALGLDIKFNFLSDGAVVGFYLELGGRSHIEVFRKAGTSFAESNAINHLCLEVESIDAAIAHIRGLGIAITDKKFGCDDTWQAWIADPDGVKIELFEYTAASAQFAGGDRVLG